MGKLRTPEQLQLLFQKSKELNLRKRDKQKQKQKEAYRKASEAVKKELADKLPTITKITAYRQKETPPGEHYQLTIYHSNLIERETDENELYQTREELENAEPGAIRWDVWNTLVKKLTR